MAERGWAWSQALDRLGEIDSVMQHGDYGLGNLLVTASRLTIIDFEEFGIAAMPLLDSLNLAFSSYHFGGTALHGGSLSEDITECLGANSRASSIPEDCLPGMLLHFILWKILQGWEGRKTLVARFRTHAERLAESPEHYLPRSYARIQVNGSAP